MKCAVFVSAGLGDALLLVPLIKTLKADGAHVTGIFTSEYGCHELFEGTSIFDEMITASDSKLQAISLSLGEFQQFERAYLNVFAATRKNMVIANSIANKVFANHLPKGLPSVLKKKVRYVEPVQGIHDATQNIRLYNELFSDKELSIEMLHVPFKPAERISAEITTPYLAIQLSAGNNELKYKNWNINSWKRFIEAMADHFSNFQLVLVGDANETGLANEVIKLQLPNLISTAGNTSITEIIGVLNNAVALVGLDGGLMHLAAVMGKPTFTLWGISDPVMYGYGKLDSNLHRLVEAKGDLTHSWLNQSTEDLTKDHYLDSLLPEEVFQEFCSFIDQLQPVN